MVSVSCYCRGRGFAAIIGFVGLVILLVRLLGGSLKSGLFEEKQRHAIYAEVFAVWLLLFLSFMTLAAMSGMAFADENAALAMGLSLFAFFASLVALFSLAILLRICLRQTPQRGEMAKDREAAPVATRR